MAEKAKKDEKEARRKEEQKNMSEETRIWRERDEIFDEEGKEAMQDTETANELLVDGTAKLQRALCFSSSCDTQKNMVEIAKANQETARIKKVRGCFCSSRKKCFCGDSSDYMETGLK